jgi:hypothetical protein
MVGAASVGSLLARPKSGIAPRLPQVTLPIPRRAKDPCLRPLTRFATYQSLVTARRISNRYTKLLEIELTHSQQTRKHFLIATICPTFFSPAPLRAILIGTPSRLEIDLTHSQQTRKDFLIGTICPTFFRPRRSSPITGHSSLVTASPHFYSIQINLTKSSFSRAFQ